MNKKRIILGLGAFAILGLTLSSCKKIETFTVTFYNGDTEVSSQTVTSGYNALVPDAPTATGKIFNGWYEDEQLTTAFDFGQIIESDKSVYAAWVNECVVTFKDGAKTITTQTVVSGYNATVPTAPTSEGKVFNGWYADAALTTPFDFGSVINENKTIYAAWVDSTNNSGSNDNENENVNENVTYTVTFDSNGGSDVTAATVDANGKVTKPTNPTRTGFEFVCWTYQGAEYDFNTAITKSITLVAKWKAEATKQTYGFGEGLTPWTDLEEEAGTHEYTNNDKTYVGLASEVTLYDITFNAASDNKNRLDKTETSVSYNTQGASIVVVLKSAGKISLEGSWASDKEGKVSIKNGSTSVYESPSNLSQNEAFTISKELAAGTYTISSTKSIKISKLSVERTIEYCTVSYVSEQGYTPIETILEKNEKLPKLPTIVASGYVFEGWYTNSSYTTLFDLNSEIAQDVTLYAKWKVYNPDDYATVSYVIAPSTQEINDSVVEKNKTLASLPILNNLNGYRFDGWYEDEDFETKFVSSKAITGDITLFAKFVKQIEVTYVYDNSTEIASLKFDANKALTYYPSVQSIYGKKFVGWKLTDGTAFDKTSTVNSDITLVAAYEDIDTAASVGVLSSSGYQEGLYAEFMEFTGADSYNAYVKSSTGSYTKLDNQLIRKYKEANSTNTYMRVDAVGLNAGSYSLKIVPVIDGNEYDTAKAEITDLLVVAHDRSGFGFVKGTSSGAYNDDGTLKANARVIYVSNDNKDTVSTTAIVSKQTVTVSGVQNIITAMKGQKGISDPVCIRILGNVTDPSTLTKGDLYVDDVKNLTIEGIGTDATANGYGIVIKNSSCVEIRNLGFMNCNSNEGDDCGLQQANDHIWVHNCDFFYGDAGSDADQAKGDGALDTKKSTYITHSYNHFWDCGKCNLQGMKSETTSNCITYHHNWYDHSDSRHPRIRTCTVHIYNNYFDGNAKYGVGMTMGGSAFVENNYFRSTSTLRPMLTSKQGTDAQGDGTFSGENGGIIKEYGNVFDGTAKYIPYSTNNTSFDAYDASSRDEEVPSSVKALAGGTTYNNFDTASDMYSYTVQSAEDAKNTVIANAGRVQGGDFEWTFTAADDADYSVNTGLKAKLKSYTSNLISVQGISESTGSGSNEPEPSNPDTPTEDAAQTVIDLITALPEPANVVESDRTAINAAKSAYNALSAEDKAKVTNSDKLTQCINALPAANTTGFTYKMPSTKQESGTYDLASIGDNVVLKYISDGGDSISSTTYDGVKYNTLAFGGASNKTARRFIIDLSSYQSTDTFTLSMIIAAKDGKKVYVIDSSNMGDKTKDSSYKTPAEGKYYISFTATDATQLVTSGTNNLVGGKIYYITCGDKVPLALIKLEKNN